jgi:hypothetical protein
MANPFIYDEPAQAIIVAKIKTIAWTKTREGPISADLQPTVLEFGCRQFDPYDGSPSPPDTRLFEPV